MKRIIEIPDKVVEAIQNGEDYRYDIHTAIAQSKPYEPEEESESEWVLDSDGLPICQKCGEVALQRIFVKMPHLIQDVRMVRSNYCPNCGRKMKGRFAE